jgi:hypothetical protein
MRSDRLISDALQTPALDAPEHTVDDRRGMPDEQHPDPPPRLARSATSAADRAFIRWGRKRRGCRAVNNRPSNFTAPRRLPREQDDNEGAVLIRSYWASSRSAPSRQCNALVRAWKAALSRLEHGPHPAAASRMYAGNLLCTASTRVKMLLL